MSLRNLMSMEKREAVSLRPYNTFGIDATAAAMYDCRDVAELRAAIRVSADGRRYVLGGGSNVLFLGDFDGAIIRPLMGGIEVVGEAVDCVTVRAGAGVAWDDFVAWCVAHGLYGAENLSGVPGNVGAAPVQNIGAYGVEAKDVIDTVDGLRMDTAEAFRMTAAECAFGYRDSVFKHSLRGICVITAVTFRLSRKPAYNLGYGALSETVRDLGGASLANVRKAVISIRDSKLPDPKVTGNAGSFFKNPEVDSCVADKLKLRYPDMPSYPLPDGRVKIPAGWLIERSGWKGRSLGRAAVHSRQALVLVNLGGAAGADIVKLCDAVRADVLSSFGLDLSPEVNFVS